MKAHITFTYIWTLKRAYLALEATVGLPSPMVVHTVQDGHICLLEEKFVGSDLFDLLEN